MGPVQDDERVEVTVRVRPKAQLVDAMQAATGNAGLIERAYLTREQHALAYGASAEDLLRVADFGRASGLEVVESSESRRSVVLAGPASAMKAAFEVDLQHFQHASGTYRGRVGSITVPVDLADIVVGVFGLDSRPQATCQLRRPKPSSTSPAPGSFTPPAVASLYAFPTGLDGTGQCIALIELGGGFRPADLSAYFSGLQKPAPRVTAVSVDQGKNAPTTASGADGEVMLDIEVAGAIAPGASIAVYFAPNTDQGFLDAVTTAVHDSVNKPSVISISWGSAESQWTAQAMTQFDEAFQAAATMGVTICVAAGDNGSGDNVTDGAPHVDFPASSPNALACGGTSLTSDGTSIGSESVWNDGADGGATGGGVSSVFPLPAYQSACGVPPIAGTAQTGRGVPDVAGNADPATGYQIRVDGQDMVVGGTSAVAPLWASLIALMNQKLAKPVGQLQPMIYEALAGKGLFNDIVTGSNGAYSAVRGWDACTGWGSPIGSALLLALEGGSQPGSTTPVPPAPTTAWGAS